MLVAATITESLELLILSCGVLIEGDIVLEYCQIKAFVKRWGLGHSDYMC